MFKKLLTALLVVCMVAVGAVAFADGDLKGSAGFGVATDTVWRGMKTSGDGVSFMPNAKLEIDGFLAEENTIYFNIDVAYNGQIENFNDLCFLSIDAGFERDIFKGITVGVGYYNAQVSVLKNQVSEIYGKLSYDLNIGGFNFTPFYQFSRDIGTNNWNLHTFGASTDWKETVFASYTANYLQNGVNDMFNGEANIWANVPIISSVYLVPAVGITHELPWATNSYINALNDGKDITYYGSISLAITFE